MLYQIYDWHRAALEPWRLFAQAANEHAQRAGRQLLGRGTAFCFLPESSDACQSI